MKVHEKYNTLDVDWIANPPSGWNTKSLKYFLDGVSGGGTPSTGDAEYWSGNIPWVSSKDVKTDILFDTEEHISARAVDESSTSWVEPNTVLIVARSGILKHTLPVALAGVPLTINQDIKAFRTGADLLSRFLFWKLKGKARDLLDICGKVGATVESIDVEALLGLPFSIPSVREQTAIADYLDRETARIDELVEKKKQLIELLKEERLAIINQAVTRGLDPNAKLKPSGIAWSRDIPEHWEVKRLKYLAELKSGDGITSEAIQEEGEFPVFGGNGFRGYFSSFTHDGDHVLIGRQGALCGNVNYAAGKFWASDHAVVVTVLDGDEIKWLGELLTVMNLNQYSQSAAQPGLSVETIKNLYVPVPPRDEQKEIVGSIERLTLKIDATIAKVVKEIGLLNEYRSALISEVVTGKLRVS